MTAPSSTQGALAGIRVADFSHFIAGPICAQSLGDMGADVIKVENISAGDDFRRFPPFTGGESSPFLWANRNKRGIALDLKNVDAIKVAKDLIAGSDILVENFTTGVMERFGLGSEAMLALNPRLIYCSISAYGRDGAFADRAGFDPVIQAETGFMSMNGAPDGPAMRTGPAVMDVSTALTATIAVLGALNARHTSGRGQRVEVCLFDVASLMLGFHAMNHLVTGNNPTRFGNNSPDSGPVGVYQAADGPLYIACANDRTYQRLVTNVLGRADLVDHPDFATNPKRASNEDKLTAVLDAELGKRTRADWMPLMNAASVPAGQVRTIAEAFTSPEMAARRLVSHISHPTAGQVPNIASPLLFSNTPVVPPTAAPTLGQHTRSVLADVMGYSAEQIAALAASGAIRGE